MVPSAFGNQHDSDQNANNEASKQGVQKSICNVATSIFYLESLGELVVHFGVFMIFTDQSKNIEYFKHLCLQPFKSTTPDSTQAFLLNLYNARSVNG